MRVIKKVGDFLNAAVEALFAVLMLFVLVATVIVDKHTAFRAPNTVAWPNIVYYLGAAALLFVIFCCCYARSAGDKPALSGRAGPSEGQRFALALLGIAAAVGVIQYFISRWMPYQALGTDFTNISEAAWAVHEGGSLKSFSYFQRSPNNVNMAIVFVWIYKIIPRRDVIVWLGALATNASAALVSMTVYNVTRRRNLSLVVAVASELLMALTWRSFLPYTDNYGMVFVALVIWLYTTQLKPVFKIPLIVACSAIGAFIKITCVIPLLALGLALLIRWMRSDAHGVNLKRVAWCALCLALFFGGMFKLQEPIRARYGYVPGKYPKGWQYLLMVGQNTEGMGTVYSGNVEARRAYIKEYEDLAQVNRAFIANALASIRERGLWGNVVFYVKKLNAAYNDGYFHNVQTARCRQAERNLIYELYMKNGRFYQPGAALMQVLWDAVLLTMMLWAACGIAARLRRRGTQPGGIGARDDAMASALLVVQIAILGTTLYILCLEGRSKYLFMLLPVYMVAFGLMLHELCAALARKKRR